MMKVARTENKDEAIAYFVQALVDENVSPSKLAIYVAKLMEKEAE